MHLNLKLIIKIYKFFNSFNKIIVKDYYLDRFEIIICKKIVIKHEKNKFIY